MISLAQPARHPIPRRGACSRHRLLQPGAAVVAVCAGNDGRHQSARTGASHTKHGKQGGPLVKLCEFVWSGLTMWCFWVLQCKKRLGTFSGGPVCRLRFAGYFPLFLRDDQHHNGEVQVAKFYFAASGTPVLVCS